MSALVQDIKDLGVRIDRLTCRLVVLRDVYESADYKLRGSISLVQKAIAAMKLSERTEVAQGQPDAVEKHCEGAAWRAA